MSPYSNPDSFDTQGKNSAQNKRRPWRYRWIKLLLVILSFTCFFVIFLKVRYSPKTCVNEFITALDAEDYQSLKAFISCDDVAITEDSLKPLVDLYHADSQFRSDIKNTLNKDLNTVNLDTYNNKYWIQLIPHRKFLVKTYTIQIQPITVTLSTNLNQVNVSYANISQVIDSADDTLTVPLLPGLYQFEAMNYDSIRDTEHTLTNTLTLCSDQSLGLNFDCSTLVLEIPNGYHVESISVDGIDLKDEFQLVNGNLQYYPVFSDEIITITCDNSWKESVTTTFTIPEEYVNEIYHHYCDFNSTSMEFTYSKGLTVTNLKINGKNINDLSNYVNPEESSIFLSDLTDSTTIETELKAPWGETFTDSYTVSKENFDEYYHNIDCYLSEDTKESILGYAADYYFNLFEALNSDDMDTLAQYADDDEMANDFFVMLENIEYDYENYSDQAENYEEDILLDPMDVFADKSQLDKYSDIFTLNVLGKVTTTTTSMDEESMTPVVESGEENYNVILHIVYDATTSDWTVTASYYDYNTLTQIDPVKLMVEH